MESSAESARVVTPAGRGALDTLSPALPLPNPARSAELPRSVTFGDGCREAVEHRNMSPAVSTDLPRARPPRTRRRHAFGPIAASVALSTVCAAFVAIPPASARVFEAGLVGNTSQSESTELIEQWLWPIPAPIRVVSPFRAPPTPYSAGHRGVDMAVDRDTRVIAPAAGVVSFAGRVVDRGIVAVDHGGGVISAIEPVDALVEQGTPIAAGDLIGIVASGGHCAAECVHFGVRINGEYVSPYLFLGGLPRAVLLPLH